MIYFILNYFPLVYECINLISPIFLHNFFDNLTSVHQYNTRQACKGDIFYDTEKYTAVWLKVHYICWC